MTGPHWTGGARWGDQPLANLDLIERKLLAVIAEPGPLVQAGQIVQNAYGDPAPDEAVRAPRRSPASPRSAERAAWLGGEATD